MNQPGRRWWKVAELLDADTYKAAQKERDRRMREMNTANEIQVRTETASKDERRDFPRVSGLTFRRTFATWADQIDMSARQLKPSSPG